MGISLPWSPEAKPYWTVSSLYEANREGHVGDNGEIILPRGECAIGLMSLAGVGTHSCSGTVITLITTVSLLIYVHNIYRYLDMNIRTYVLFQYIHCHTYICTVCTLNTCT